MTSSLVTAKIMELLSFEKEFHRVSKVSVKDLQPYHTFVDISRNVLSSRSYCLIVLAFIKRRLSLYFNWIQIFDFNDSFILLCGNTGDPYYEQFVFPFNDILEFLLITDFPLLRSELLLKSFIDYRSMDIWTGVHDVLPTNNE